jgi:hypothetical protein
MLSKRHPGLDPLGDDLRKHIIMIYRVTKEWPDVGRHVLIVVLAVTN